MGQEREGWRYGSLEEVAARFWDRNIKVISFDVFDTLLMRPVEREEDFFELLDKGFGQMSSAQISFRKLRMEAEAALRRRIIRKEIGKEDVCLHEIYQVLAEEMGIPLEVSNAMEELEYETEWKLCRARKSGVTLFQEALSTGKPIILISDMYLSAGQIGKMLEKNGFYGMEAVFVSSEMGKRKSTGHLFDAAAKWMGVAPEAIFHIGDNQEADCRMAEKRGFQAAWLPKALDVYDSCGCAHQVEKICADLTDWEAAKRSVGIGNMRALAAAKYFDDPFRIFEKKSDYNGDPYFVGYGALGMELLSLVRWLADNICRDRVRKMLFLARDGYLPMKAYELYQSFRSGLPPAGYLHVSRLAVLPAMAKAPEDFYDLPVDISYQTPRKLLRLLAFCTRDGAAERLLGERQAEGLSDEPFSKESYGQFVTDFIRGGYDAKKHRQAVARISEYLRNNGAASVTEESALFDMGYSGRIAAAIHHATGLSPCVYYFHADSREHFRYEKRAGMKIRTFFDFSPYMESSLREYSYLEPSASCVSYTEDLKPIYDAGPSKGYEKTVLAMQQGALDFVRDYMEAFAEYEQEAGFRCHEGAMPFEAFLRHCSLYDRRMYQNVLMDDELWGGRRNIDLLELMETRLRKMPEYARIGVK